MVGSPEAIITGHSRLFQPRKAIFGSPRLVECRVEFNINYVVIFLENEVEIENFTPNISKRILVAFYWNQFDGDPMDNSAGISFAVHAVHISRLAGPRTL